MDVKDGAPRRSLAIVSQAASRTKAVAVGYWRGLSYPFKGAKFVFFEHPGLARYWIFPIIITALLLAFSFALGWHVHEPIADAIWTDPTEHVLMQKDLPDSGKDKPALKHIEADFGWLAETGHWVHSAFEVLILLLIWGLGVILAVVLSNVIAAPFNDFLSEEVERILTGREGPPFALKTVLRDAVRTIGLEVLKLAIYFVVMVPLFLIAQIVPVVGPIAYSVFGFIFTAIYFSIDYVDWPASRKNRSVSYRFGMVTEHFMPMLGFGTGVWLFLFIPLVNLLFMPAAVAGGTLLYLDLESDPAES